MRASPLFAFALCCVAVPAGLRAQAMDATRPDAVVGVSFRTVTFGTGFGVKSLTELAVPLGLTIPVGRRVTLDAGTYYVNAKRTDESDSSATISGLTDVVIRGAFQLKPDVAVLTAAVSIPTGQASLDQGQVLLAGATATDLIPFPVQNFGSGFSMTTGLALATPLGAWAVGLAGSVRVNGSYEPFMGDTTSLSPGAEMRVRVGADRIVGQGRFSLGLTFSNFSTDELGGTSLKPGSRIIPQVSWSFPVGNNNLSLYAWNIYRNVKEDTLTLNAKENTLSIGAMMAIRTGRNTLRPQIEYRQAWRGPGGLQANGKLFGVGARYSVTTGGRVTMTPGVRFDMGSLPDAGGTSYSFTGISANLSIRTSF